VTDNTNVDCDR